MLCPASVPPGLGVLYVVCGVMVDLDFGQFSALFIARATG